MTIKILLQATAVLVFAKLKLALNVKGQATLSVPQFAEMGWSSLPKHVMTGL